MLKATYQVRRVVAKKGSIMSLNKTLRYLKAKAMRSGSRKDLRDLMILRRIRQEQIPDKLLKDVGLKPCGGFRP